MLGEPEPNPYNDLHCAIRPTPVVDPLGYSTPHHHLAIHCVASSRCAQAMGRACPANAAATSPLRWPRPNLETTRKAKQSALHLVAHTYTTVGKAPSGIGLHAHQKVF